MPLPFRIAGLGEVLWDVFPDGPRFGGATANFACSVAGIGAEDVRASLISAVGNEDLGDQSFQELSDRSVETSTVFRTPQPTGQVFVELSSDGQPSYRFLEDTAWDNIPSSPQLLDAMQSLDAVCFGTLGQRSAVSRETIRQCVLAVRGSANEANCEWQTASPDCLRILDINLRPPYWDHDVILESLPLANVLKLNSDELPVLRTLLGLSPNDIEAVRQMIDRYQLKLVALTRGANGSVLADQQGRVSERPPTLVNVVDTVGAGDAFTAAITIGMLAGQSLPNYHRWADDVAAFVCTQRGATPRFPTRLQYREYFECD